MAMSPQIIIVGDGGVGKTSYINSLNKCKFDGRYIPTMNIKTCDVTDDMSYQEEHIIIHKAEEKQQLI